MTRPAAPTAPVFADPIETARVLRDLAQNAQTAAAACAGRLAHPEPLPYDPATVAKAFAGFGVSLMFDPMAVANAQLRGWQDWTALWRTSASRALGQAAEPVIAPAKGDRRFSAAAWSDEPAYDFVKQAYLLGSRQMQDLIGAVDMPAETRTKVDFFSGRLLDAASPSNFPVTNPEVAKRTAETGGLNLLNGLNHLLEDVARGADLVQRRAPDVFEVGVDIAATPGAVVFQNDLLQLIQYAPSTEMVLKRPLLFVPPLVNKYYLFDLTPKSSYLKWLVDQGHTVFVISWVNPTVEHSAFDLADYVKDGVVAAIGAVEAATGETSVDLVSYCLGGTLTAAAMAYLTAKGEGDRVATATLIATLVDFKSLGEWSSFLGAEDVAAFERYLDDKGYVEADHLTQLFSAVRANDLIWSSVVKHYLMAEEARPSDLLTWFDDGARIPAAVLKDYLRLLLVENRLSQPGGVVIDGVALDLGAIQTPVFVVAFKDDHVAAWPDALAGAKLFGGPTRLLLGGSGHNAGMINPPGSGKHGYWTGEAACDPETWLAGAQKHADSWWPEWRGWVTAVGEAETVDAATRTPGSGALPALEAAPGSYVRVRH